MNKSYVDSKSVPKQWIENNFLSRNSPASTMARNLSMDGHNITYLRAPDQNHHATTKGYNDMKLPLLVGSMQGEIGIISGLANLTERNDAVPNHYADSQIQNLRGLITNLSRQVDTLQTRVVILERLSQWGTG